MLFSTGSLVFVEAAFSSSLALIALYLALHLARGSGLYDHAYNLPKRQTVQNIAAQPPTQYTRHKASSERL